MHKLNSEPVLSCLVYAMLGTECRALATLGKYFTN